MTQKSQIAKALTALVALALFTSGCTKKRDAALPDDQQETVFAISDFGELKTENSAMTVETEERPQSLSLGESAKATAEKGLVTVTAADVPQRLQFMFKGLEMTGQAGRKYPITLSVDKQFVTAYKIIENTSDLSILEKEIAQIKDEVLLQKQIQKTKEASKIKSLVAQLKEARKQKSTAMAKKKATVLVPLFKFKITKYGILERTKNELKEETSTLRLKPSDWTRATHLEISVNPADRLPVGLDPASKGDMDRTFVMDRINNKILSAGTLKDEFQIPLNTPDETRVLTLLDINALHVFEVTQLDKVELTNKQKQDLSQGTSANIQACSDEIKKALPEDQRKDCILILRYDVPVKFVKPELPVVDHDGNQDSKVTFKEVRSNENVGLVQIDKNVQPLKVEPDNLMDPRTMIRIVDIKDKEFFFKRTLEDAPVTTPFPPGMAGNLTIVKFDLTEDHLVVRKADKLVNFKTGSNDVDYEEILTIPVRYLKRDLKDASGANYSITRLVPASNLDAEYVELDWRQNAVSPGYSPYETLQKECFSSLTDSAISDVDMRLDKGVFSFSYNYTAGLRIKCIDDYKISDEYNGEFPAQTTARIKERVSFKLNDGSTDVSYVEKVPFRAQNELGYGVWTIGKLNPTAHGLTGREGQEINYPVVQDFRNGKILMYTITGLEPSVNLDPEIRQLYKDTIREVVNSWDFAYHQVFKGTAFDREGRYVDLQFSGENGIEAKVGDLDKNIVHFENKFNDHHGILGVSQVGFNPRSGIVVADSLIVYAGNLQRFVAASQRNLKVAQSWADKKEAFKQKAIAEFTENAKKEQEEAKSASSGNGEASPEAEAQKTMQFAKQLIKMSGGEKADLSNFVGKNKLSASAGEIMSAVKQLRTLGAGNYDGAIPNIQGAWIHRVLKQLGENPFMDSVELEGIIASEMLAVKSSNIPLSERTKLQRTVRLGNMRARLNAQLKNKPGCLLTAHDSVARKFATMSFKDALREELYFDIGHEMGHSQGLTHNFIGSVDKANFTNEDGSESKRNYSSIMDYIEPGKFQWGGIGTYDIHALRASHLGLFEIQPKLNLKEADLTDKDLIDGKYISIKTIKDHYAQAGWNNFSKDDLEGILKPYMYCTDIHVGPTTPLCQRFDAGTSATEIVENMINDFEQDYAVSYHSWDRNSFGWEESNAAVARTMNTLFQMRQFLDEMFYLAIKKPESNEVGDFVGASFKAYSFYNQLIRTPDADSLFETEDRFVAVPYSHKEIGEDGKPTGKILESIAVVEKRAPLNLFTREDRIDTVGFDDAKALAMSLLTMKGFPSYRYTSQSFFFSFLDFEKYFIRMKPENSIISNTFAEMMLDKLRPAFLDEDGFMRFFEDENAKASITQTMRVYAGISAILNLESSTLAEKDNFANLFKVGSSLGQAPADRVALSTLGVNENSKTRMSYWALDNALISDIILKEAAKKNFFIRNSPDILPLMENMVVAQFKMLLAGEKDTAAAEAANKARTDLIEKLKLLNANGDIISEAELKGNPNAMTIEKQVDVITGLNIQVSSLAVALVNAKGAQQITEIMESGDELTKLAEKVGDNLPLTALGQKAIRSGLDKVGKELSTVKGMEKLAKLGEQPPKFVNGSQLEVSYGVIMKNIEFLNKLTLLTNPEYNR